MSMKRTCLTLTLALILFFVGLLQAEAKQDSKVATPAVYLFSINGEFVKYDLGRSHASTFGVLSNIPTLARLLPPYVDPRTTREGASLRIARVVSDPQTHTLLLLIKMVDVASKERTESEESEKPLLVSLRASDLSLLAYRQFSGDAKILLDSEHNSLFVSTVEIDQKSPVSTQLMSSSLEVLEIPNLKSLRKVEESVPASDFMLAKRSFNTLFSEEASMSADGRSIVDGLAILTPGSDHITREAISYDSIVTPEIGRDLSRFYKKDISSGRDYLPSAMRSVGTGKVMMVGMNSELNSSFAILVDLPGRRVVKILQTSLSWFHVMGGRLFEERLKKLPGGLMKTGEIMIRDLAALDNKPRRIFRKELAGNRLDHKFLCGSPDGKFVYLSGDKYLFLDISNPEKEVIAEIGGDLFASSETQCVFVR